MIRSDVERLFRETYKAISRRLLIMKRGQERILAHEAEEIIQNAFVVMLHRAEQGRLTPETFEDVKDPIGFCMKYVGTAMRRYYSPRNKEGDRQMLATESSEFVPETVDERWMPASQRREKFLAAFHEALANLPVRHRQVLELSMYASMPANAIAEELGLAPSWVGDLRVAAGMMIEKELTARGIAWEDGRGF